MPQRILVMGLPGSGKTYFAQQLKQYIEERTSLFRFDSCRDIAFDTLCRAQVSWFNADDVRKKYNDWDFSAEGRLRQSQRMRELADSVECDFVICDFIAPLNEVRKNFDAHWTIWLDTIDQGRFEDTNAMFEPPAKYDFRILEKKAEYWAKYVADHILLNCRKPNFDCCST